MNYNMLLLNSSRSDARRPNQSSIPLRNRCNLCECLAAQFHVKESHDSLFVIVYHISDFAWSRCQKLNETVSCAANMPGAMLWRRLRSPFASIRSCDYLPAADHDGVLITRISLVHVNRAGSPNWA